MKSRTTITVEGRDLEELQKFQSALDTIKTIKVFHAIRKPIKEAYKPRGRSGKTKVVTDPAEIFFMIIGDLYVEKFIGLHPFKQGKVWRLWVKTQSREAVIGLLDTL